MAPSVAVLIASMAAVLILGGVLVATAPSWRVPRALETGRSRLGSAVDSVVPHVGRGATAAGVALAGFALTLVIGWFLGKLAHALEPSVDVPVFEWFRTRQLPGSWTDAWNVLTKMGNRAQTQRIAVVGAVLLAVLWRRRGWWTPFLALPLGYLLEKFGQMLLAATVHRGHPPTTLGTYPSGGCARLVVVYGLVIFLVLRWKRVSRRGWVAGWTLLSLLTVLEGYSRTYLLKHWFTDVVGGVIYGGLILGLMVGAVCVLDRVAVDAPPTALDTPQPSAAAVP
ncbi:phosphatase PAP2 family protein [Lapillicoccus sp.]|jgi:membrane-associated phospholipid phosphatase|uniref:phosphatase PAP2 family protein n=1 Tax=Lapillicoccus sp. TaxID=1909287 RepID=UPI0025DD3CDD|nr:phosphatase PAP2 family protein [Lapillicoccus sp.]